LRPSFIGRTKLTFDRRRRPVCHTERPPVPVYSAMRMRQHVARLHLRQLILVQFSKGRAFRSKWCFRRRRSHVCNCDLPASLIGKYWIRPCNVLCGMRDLVVYGSLQTFLLSGKRGVHGRERSGEYRSRLLGRGQSVSESICGSGVAITPL